MIRKISGKTIYEEKVRFPLIRGIVALFAILTIIFLVTYLFQRISGEPGENAVPFWFGLLVLSALALFTLFLANLVTLTIRMTDAGVLVGFGIFRTGVRWEDIRECRLDRESSIISAANWGVSMGFTGRRFRRMYNVMGSPRVVLELKGGRQTFVFSTREPDKVIDIISKQTKEKE